MGYGRVGQHRKSGGKGGKGKAGGRKHFWLHTVKFDPDRYVKTGFKTPSGRGNQINTINVGDLENLALSVVDKEDREYKIKTNELDLEKLGYSKLLGTGKIGKPLEIRVPHATSIALEKVESAGGKVITSE